MKNSSTYSVPCGFGGEPTYQSKRAENDNLEVGKEAERERDSLSSPHPDPSPPDIMSLKQMLEKLGIPKTHLELKKLIREVSSGSGETFSYPDFLRMMLGKRSAILKM